MRLRHGRWAFGFVAFACLVVGAIAVGLIVWAERTSVDAIHGHLEQAAPWLLLWRMSLFSILVVYWRELAGFVSRLCALDATSRADLVRWRWRAAAGLLVMDLVLVEDLIGKFQRLLT